MGRCTSVLTVTLAKSYSLLRGLDVGNVTCIRKTKYILFLSLFVTIQVGWGDWRHTSVQL